MHGLSLALLTFCGLVILAGAFYCGGDAHGGHIACTGFETAEQLAKAGTQFRGQPTLTTEECGQWPLRDDATAGIIVGTVTLTGIGLVMTEIVEFLSAGNFVIMLVLTGLICLILGRRCASSALRYFGRAIGSIKGSRPSRRAPPLNS